MRNTLIRSISCLIFFITLTSYTFINDPIDVVIPAIEKDLETLHFCIEGIRQNCPSIRRVIVVSKEPLTDQAEWYPESLYPFTKTDVSQAIFQTDNAERSGWYFQQLLKLYAPLVIPNISSNVLILDADTIFLKAVSFLNEKNGGLYNPGRENNSHYFNHASKLLPSFRRYSKRLSGISHHMLFQRPVIEHLFSLVESHHALPFWKAFCSAVNPGHFSGASEYEIYFNFVFQQTDQVNLRLLKWGNVSGLDWDAFNEKGFDFAACHSWMRNPSSLKEN